jgi:CRISPR/Cas system-associated exonuclease Cas4 (RecB family)
MKVITEDIIKQYNFCQVHYKLQSGVGGFISEQEARALSNKSGSIIATLKEGDVQENLPIYNTDLGVGLIVTVTKSSEGIEIASLIKTTHVYEIDIQLAKLKTLTLVDMGHQVNNHYFLYEKTKEIADILPVNTTEGWYDEVKYIVEVSRALVYKKINPNINQKICKRCIYRHTCKYSHKNYKMPSRSTDIDLELLGV